MSTVLMDAECFEQIIDLYIHRAENPCGWLTVNNPLQRLVYCKPSAWIFFSVYRSIMGKYLDILKKSLVW